MDNKRYNIIIGYVRNGATNYWHGVHLIRDTMNDVYLYAFENKLYILDKSDEIASVVPQDGIVDNILLSTTKHDSECWFKRLNTEENLYLDQIIGFHINE